ncbi:hypothetical protein Tco_1480753 [Tanacetum coccineum]
MANQEQNPPHQEQPFVAAKQVGFNLEDIILNTNNEVALLYPEHNNKVSMAKPWFETVGYGEAVPTKGTLKKSLLPYRWRLLMAQII